MLRIRIVAAGAFVSIILFVSGVGAGSATAQTAADGAPGKPLQLMKIAERPKQTKKPRARPLAKSSAKSRLTANKQTKPRSAVAEAADQPAPAQTAEPPSSASIWPAVNALPPTTEPPPAWAATDQGPTEMVVGGQTVQLASPGEVNEIDLAAKADAAMTGDAAPASSATTTAPTDMIASAEAKTDSLKAAAARPASAVGSTSWILQVLAALGGAATAASLAWFLIGSTPQRTYG